MAKPISPTPVLTQRGFLDILKEDKEIQESNKNIDRKDFQKKVEKVISDFEKKFPSKY